MSCLVLGDSIAVGTGQALRAEGVVCRLEAAVGISTAGWRVRFAPWDIPADVVVISLGSNDGGRAAYPDLWQIRKRIKAKKVIWILPANNHVAASAISAMATELGDYVMAFAPAKDGIHPHSYTPLAEHIKPIVQRYG